MLKTCFVSLFALICAVPLPASAFDLNDFSRGLNAVSDLEEMLRRNQNASPRRSRQVDRAQPPARLEKRATARRAVRDVQTLLSALGYDPGPADGLMGRRTRNAIRAFERDFGLKVSGNISRTLLNSLRAHAAANSGNRILNDESRPSFDCAKASTAVEHAICASSDLAELDRAVARHYAAAMEGLDAEARAQLQAGQRAWISRRDRCGADVMCLVRALGKRSQELVVFSQNRRPGTQGHEASATTAGQGGQEAQPSATRAAGEDVIILAVGSGGSFLRGWLDKESIQRQRNLLASMVAAETVGTEFESIFVNSQPLSKADIRSAAKEAGIAASSKLDAYISKGVLGTLQDVENGYLAFDYNQFEVARFKAALREKALAGIARDRRNSPQRLTLICGLRVGEYDFAKQRFPFGEKELETCFAGEQSAGRNLGGYRARFQVRTNLRPQGFAVDPATAEGLITRLGGARFVLAIPAHVSGRISRDRHGRPEFLFDAVPTGSMELRSGQDIKEVLYRYPDTALQDVTDTPEARKLTDFNRAWWLDTHEEVELIAERADAVPVDALDADGLFQTETGLRFSFRVKYGDGLNKGERSLAAYLRPQSDRALEEISRALHLPEQNLLVTSLPLVGAKGRFESAILVLPQDVAAYTVADELPAYEERDGGWPFAAAELIVTAEKIVTLEGGEQRLLLAGHPHRLVVRRTSRDTRWQDTSEIGSASLPRGELRQFEEIGLAWKSDLLAVGAQQTGWNLEELLREQLVKSSFAHTDAFAQRKAAAELAAGASVRSGRENIHWVQAFIRFEPYDFEREGWLVRPGFKFEAKAHEADRALKVSLLSEETPQGVMADQGMFVTMPPEEAQEFQKRSESFPVFDGFLAITISRVDLDAAQAFSMGMALRYQPVELVLFDAGKGQTIINPRSIRLRHAFAATPGHGTVTETGPVSEHPLSGPGKFTVLGVKLGADFSTSVENIAQQTGAERRLYAQTKARQAALQNEKPINDWDAYHNATLIEAAGRQEMIALYNEPPLLADRVTAIARTRLFEPGKGPSWGQLRDQLLDAYEHVDEKALHDLERTGVAVIWAEPATVAGAAPKPVDSNAMACRRSLFAAARSSSTRFLLSLKARAAGNMRPADGRAIWVDEDGQQAIPAVASTYALPQLFGDRKGCPDFEVMVLAVAIGDDGKILHFRQAVSAPAQVAVVEEERRSAAASDTSNGDFDL